MTGQVECKPVVKSVQLPRKVSWPDAHVDSRLIDRINSLVGDLQVDLNAPLLADNECNLASQVLGSGGSALGP